MGSKAWLDTVLRVAEESDLVTKQQQQQVNTNTTGFK